MYLARGFLNPVSRAVRADLAQVAGLHRTVMRAFPDDAGPRAREAHGVLFRVDEDPRRGRFVLLVQSETEPAFGRLPAGYFLPPDEDLDLAAADVLGNPAVRRVDEERAAIRAGDRFVFRLRANATRKVDTKSGPDGTKRNGRRVPVRGDEARMAWLARHAAHSGFRVADARVTEPPLRHGRNCDGRLTFAGASFEGVLVVTDPDAFRQTLARGIGPGKAYGFGLLSILRVP
jgi:CRISPR system Cascade subunit CasE